MKKPTKTIVIIAIMQLCTVINASSLSKLTRHTAPLARAAYSIQNQAMLTPTRSFLTKTEFNEIEDRILELPYSTPYEQEVIRQKIEELAILKNYTNKYYAARNKFGDVDFECCKTAIKQKNSDHSDIHSDLMSKEYKVNDYKKLNSLDDLINNALSHKPKNKLRQDATPVNNGPITQNRENLSNYNQATEDIQKQYVNFLDGTNIIPSKNPSFFFGSAQPVATDLTHALYGYDKKGNYIGSNGKYNRNGYTQFGQNAEGELEEIN